VTSDKPEKRAIPLLSKEGSGVVASSDEGRVTGDKQEKPAIPLLSKEGLGVVEPSVTTPCPSSLRRGVRPTLR
jgi:hypothetical protein